MAEGCLHFRMKAPVSHSPIITCPAPKKVLGSSCLQWGTSVYHSPTHVKHSSLVKQRDEFTFRLPTDVKAPTHTRAADDAVSDLHQAQCISKYFDGLKYEGMLFSKMTPCSFLSFYLFLTVCHPVIGGNPSCIAWAFIFCWPCNNTKLSAGFPAACLKGLFSLFKYYLPWEPWSCAQALYCIFPASISACTLKVFRFDVLCSPSLREEPDASRRKKKTHPPPPSLPMPPISPHASFPYTSNRSPSSSQNHANIFSLVKRTSYNQEKRCSGMKGYS